MPSPLHRLRPIPVALALAVVSLYSLAGTAARAQSADATPGAKGARIYCFMRGNGSDHAVSWDAAYALIKRQGSSMFRTSPEHAAVMITEAVVDNPTAFPDCGRYLGDLFRKEEPAARGPVGPYSPASGAERRP
ncbi:MAG: DUF6554 family protein [Prochlorococcaceae cyanobacterium]